MPKAEIIVATEFQEIMNDFTHPLEIIREGLQNSIDAGADEISIIVSDIPKPHGSTLNIIIEDNGKGLTESEFKNFFNLGDSTKRLDKSTIGEKGHGTIIFFNSERIKVESWQNGVKLVSIMNSPFENLFHGHDLEYDYPKEEKNVENKSYGLRISVEGYFQIAAPELKEYFSHASIVDYIKWFTVFGSIRPQFDPNYGKNAKLYLKSIDSLDIVLQKEFKFNVDKNGFSVIGVGHEFYSREVTNKNELKSLAKENNHRRWDQFFCKELYKGEIAVEAGKNLQVLIWAEGDKLKRLYNPLLREKITVQTRDFQYKVSDRYGFWACKNFIPIQKIDDWIIGKGQYTKFHAFINFDDFSLTANRSSVENTKPILLNKIKEKLNKVFDSVLKDKAFNSWSEIEADAENERNSFEEKLEFGKRIKIALSRKRIKIGNLDYYEPKSEGEVAILYSAILNEFHQDLLTTILDYSTHKGVDFLTREQLDVPVANDSTIGYIELKVNLDKSRFNHSFKNLRKIVCFDRTGIKIGEEIQDLDNFNMQFVNVLGKIKLADHKGEVGRSIDVFIIKDFLESKSITFE